MEEGSELSGEQLADLIGLVRQHTGIAMSERKGVLLQGRLRPRLRALGLQGYGDYVAAVRRGGPEIEAFVNLVTTNDTAFFRTPAVWQYFSERFLPAWHRAHGGRTLAIWSAAAASGEECYSIAMLCSEFQERHPTFRYRLLCTDISTEVLATAEAARYQGRSVERFRASNPELFARYLLPSGAGHVVLPALRQNLQFASHNLLKNPPRNGHFDLVFLRNVLIYFDEENQRKVLRHVRSTMQADGRLILGEQESITRIETAFSFEQQHVYRIAEGA